MTEPELFQQGIAALQAGRGAEARAVFQQAVDANVATARCWLGLALRPYRFSAGRRAVGNGGEGRGDNRLYPEITFGEKRPKVTEDVPLLVSATV